MFERALAANEVTSLKSFTQLLRRNDLEDPLSKGDACNAISARCDLNRQNTKQYECFGGIDLKVTGMRHEAADLSFLGISGPTKRIDIPAFAWSNQNSSVDGCMASQHSGHPDKFDFGMYIFSNKAIGTSNAIEGSTIEQSTRGITRFLAIWTGNRLWLWACLCMALTVSMLLSFGCSQRRLQSAEDAHTALYYVAIDE
jgi:hypothetical protein